jgi:mono/diheme cytochrome c family protein
MKRRLLRWTAITLGGLVGLVFVAYAVLHVLSVRAMARTWPIPVVQIPIPTDAAAIAEGRRLGVVYSCFAGCHGKLAEGAVVFDQPLVGRIVAPNLTASARRYSDAELAVALRHGLRPDGRSLMVMPSQAFVALDDADLGRIIAAMKSLPETAGMDRSVSLGPLGRIALGLSQLKTSAQMIADSVPPPEASGEQAARGRYLARTLCAECHAPTLRGETNPSFTSPTLQTTVAYSLEAFTRLLRTGVALGDRDLAFMGPWARANLSSLKDQEIAALYSYLHALPDVTRPN